MIIYNYSESQNQQNSSLNFSTFLTTLYGLASTRTRYSAQQTQFGLSTSYFSVPTQTKTRQKKTAYLFRLFVSSVDHPHNHHNHQMNNITNNNNNNASTSNNTNNTINPNVTIPRDKYEELIKEFQKLQSQNSVLKRAVVDVRFSILVVPKFWFCFSNLFFCSFFQLQFSIF